MRRINAENQPAVVYLHPWEFDPEQPRVSQFLRNGRGFPGGPAFGTTSICEKPKIVCADCWTNSSLPRYEKCFRSACVHRPFLPKTQHLLRSSQVFRVRGLTWWTVLGLLRAGRIPLLGDDRRKIFLCIADHYEPMVGNAPLHIQRERVDRWLQEYPRSVAGIADSRGRPPQHTFFYPAEVYTPEPIEKLAGLCRQGLGDVEIHLHHDNDTADHLRETLMTFKEMLFHRHGLLRKNGQGEITYGFIHGNWALCNSRPDGRWCGVNDELTVLRQTGCYADFTMPSAPSSTQTTTVNSIYYANDRSPRPKAHDRGIPAKVGLAPPEQSLLLIQGPLSLDWARKKWGFLPGLENAAVQSGFPPNLARFMLWLRMGIGVGGRPEWIFIKLHTHGALECNADILLGEPMRRFHQELAAFTAQRPGLQYYYVTAREMADLVHQAEAGAEEPAFGDSAATVRPAIQNT